MKYLINHLKTNWCTFLENEFKQTYLKKIDEFLFNHQQELIYPIKENIFRSLNYFNIEDTKIVIFGQDPYHNLNQANGLAFSVDQNISLPPSLKNIFKKLKIDKGITRTNGDLSDWAEQGILLLNITLTVFKDQANSHYHLGWHQFVKHLIMLLNQQSRPILFVCFGNYAKQLAKIVDSNKHQIIYWPHPSPLAAYRCHFFDNDLFNQIDQFMLTNYHHQIKW